ncbi:MAG: PocR ligand-binding domain-containing protein [Clostridia bacterium]|nr:PocR ligand-binding domain-containing protein [Clostridia bacterium]
MDVKYNREKLSAILTDVYQLIKTPMSIFDKDFVYVASFPSDYLTEYCSIIREDKARFNRCMRSDGEACTRCRESNESFSYHCHANILETITPIRFENLTIGYIIFGQYRDESFESAVIDYAIENGIETERFINAYRKLTVLTKEQVDATCNILNHLFLKFWLTDAITLNENKICERIKDFITENIDKKLTAELLCRNFFINKQQLYALFRQNFNMTVKEYILEKKLDKAKLLLKTTKHSVTDIAEMTGFPDYNNFIQRFKARIGITPLRYRKSCK